MRTCLLFCLLSALMSVTSARAGDADVIEIGSRRELFTDTFLIEKLNSAERRLHHPVPRQIAIVHDAAWEGAGSGYHSIIHSDGLYRMYYRGSALGVRKRTGRATGG